MSIPYWRYLTWSWIRFFGWSRWKRSHSNPWVHSC